MNTRSEEISIADADVAVLAGKISENTIDLQGQIESFGQKALETVDRLQEAKRQILREARAYKAWLSERAEWLKKERMNGGDWDYLLRKEEETRYCLEKLCLFMPSVES